MDGNALIGILYYTFMYYLPAMTANATPVFIRRGRPIDARKTFVDGRRILGDGKTYEGFIVGTYFGITVILAYVIIAGTISYFYWGIPSVIGALLGDMLGSFIKRRLDIPRGGKAFLLDQLDFFFGATIGIIIGGVLLDIYVILCGLIIIVALHVITNRIAYELKLKDVPW